MNTLRLSPNVRLRLTLDREMDLDPKGEVLSADLFRRYIAMLTTASSRQDALTRSLLAADIGLAILLMGKSVTVPVLNIGLSDLPAARESLSLLSSLTFLFLCMAFHNVQHYTAIVQVFAQRQAKIKAIDPDFVSAADTYTEWFVKLFRPKMNFYGIDFFVPGRGYRIYYGALSILISLSLTAMILLHFALVGWAAYGSTLNGLAFAIYISVWVAITLTGIMAAFTPSFDFTIPPAEKPQPDPQEPA